jgi:hypothetical protein
VAIVGLVVLGFISYRRGRTRNPEPIDDGLWLTDAFEAMSVT